MTPQPDRQLIATIRKPAVMDHWDALMDFVREQVERNLGSTKKSYGVLLAAEELLSNIVREREGCDDHEANPEADSTHVEVSSWHDSGVQPEIFELILRDDGPAFDPHFDAIPTEHPEIPVEQRRIGGLGLFLVKNSVEQVSYAYVDGHNVYQLTTSLP